MIYILGLFMVFAIVGTIAAVVTEVVWNHTIGKEKINR